MGKVRRVARVIEFRSSHFAHFTNILYLSYSAVTPQPRVAGDLAAAVKICGSGNLIRRQTLPDRQTPHEIGRLWKLTPKGFRPIPFSMLGFGEE